MYFCKDVVGRLIRPTTTKFIHTSQPWHYDRYFKLSSKNCKSFKNLNQHHFNQRPLTADTFIVFTLVKHVFIGLRATPTAFAMIISRKKLNFSLKLIRIAAKEMRKGLYFFYNFRIVSIKFAISKAALASEARLQRPS